MGIIEVWGMCTFILTDVCGVVYTLPKNKYSREWAEKTYKYFSSA